MRTASAGKILPPTLARNLSFSTSLQTRIEELLRRYDSEDYGKTRAALNSDKLFASTAATPERKSKKRIIESRREHFQESNEKIHIVSITPKCGVQSVLVGSSGGNIIIS